MSRWMRNVETILGTAVALSIILATPSLAASTQIITFDNEHNVVPSFDQAVERAKKFNVIVAKEDQYQPATIAAMKAANPRLKLLLYTKAIRTYEAELPESYYCHNAAGERVLGTDDNGAKYLMAPTSGWADYVTNRAITTMHDWGFTGLHIDGLAATRLLATDSRCIAPSGLEYTSSTWVQATGALGAKIVTACGCFTTINGVNNSVQYKATPSSWYVVQASGADKGVAEGFMRRAYDTTPISLSRWRGDVEMLKARSTRLAVYPKNWTTQTFDAKEKEMMWAYASFLLAQTPGKSMFGWSSAQGFLTSFRAIWDKGLGDPLGAYYQHAAGIYRRNYTRATVEVDMNTRTGRILPPTSRSLGRTVGAAGIR